MKAGIYLGKGNVEIKEVETPHASDNDIVIKNLYASICGTDVAVFKQGPNTGHKITIGDEFGHEMVSEVVEVGKNVKDIQLGDIVYPYPLLARGDTSRAGTTGGFSEFILIPNTELNKQVYKVDDSISIKEASLIEPFTVGCRAARRALPKNNESAIIFGAGTIGIAAAISLKYFGCNKIMICDHSDYRLNIVEKLGFEICNNKVEDLNDKALKYFGQAPSLYGKVPNVNIYIDAAGVPDMFDIYKEIGKIDSRLVVVAVVAGNRSIDVLHMTYSQQMLIGSGGYFPEDVIDVMEIMKSKKWDIESIITHIFPQDRLFEAIEKASCTESALNVVIQY